MQMYAVDHGTFQFEPGVVSFPGFFFDAQALWFIVPFAKTALMGVCFNSKLGFVWGRQEIGQ
ncbi:protein of unknown function [Pseudodesulfovibrio piezophilus C1TLV30]|uniref:Uncharacterized protein n=1 Tax=Pseudodesulfovibrio piezophilus (strain DSM 21447 / JCM 15486 / C1TLV30) TaxID=1322246 RepID=M1WNN6_PSEP2|nr:protein of unknown function [Pseudodesulfovibrio piezophilus C1TLV30]